MGFQSADLYRNLGYLVERRTHSSVAAAGGKDIKFAAPGSTLREAAVSELPGSYILAGCATSIRSMKVKKGRPVALKPRALLYNGQFLSAHIGPNARSLYVMRSLQERQGCVVQPSDALRSLIALP